MTVLPRVFSALLLLLPALLLSACGGSNKTEDATTVTVGASTTSLDIGFPERFTTISATVRDADGELLRNATVQFSTNLGSFSATEVVTRTTAETGRGGSNDAGNGVAAVRLYPGQSAGSATVTAYVNGVQTTTTVTIAGTATTPGDTTSLAVSVDLVATNASLDTKVPDRFVTLEATVRDRDNNLLSNAKVEFTSTLGSFSPSTELQAQTITTTAGIASTRLYPGSVAGTAVVTAYINGVQSQVTLTIQGETTGTTPQAATVTLENSADILDTGFPQRFVNLTATVLDGSQQLLPNANVEFTTTLGSFSATEKVSSVVVTTGQADKSGIATVRLYPDKTPGSAEITAFINGFRDTANIEIVGSNLNLPVPTSISVSAASDSLFVTGLGDGYVSNTTLTIRLLTAGNTAARDGATGVDNVRVTLLTKPSGGEVLSGINAAAEHVQSSSTIDVNTKNGVATVTLSTGTLPGLVQIKAEALTDEGLGYSPSVQSTNATIAINSGPVHTINVTYPQNGMNDQGNGLYRRAGTLVVTDRYGNAVTDGTMLNLGILDSVISSNVVTDPDPTKNPSTSANSSTLSDPISGQFLTDSITRSNIARFIETSDRVLILNSAAKDRSRFVAAAPMTENQLNVNKAYINTAQNLEYLVGASLLGTQVSGTVDGNIVTGRTSTVSGAAAFYITYPANRQTLLIGCVDPTVDTRHQPLGSAQIWLVAETEDGNAVLTDNSACLTGISPLSLTNNSGVTSISSSTAIPLSLEDAGEVELPFVNLIPTVSYTVNNGNLDVSVGNCTGRSDRRTNEFGICNLLISVSGGIAGDTAKITINASNSASVEIDVQR